MDKKWNKRFRELANLVATWSKDTTKVGCVIIGSNKKIISTGYNGFPSNVFELDERKVSPVKYLYTSHAEENAIIQALGRPEIHTDTCTLYLSDGLFPCANCARLIIGSGINSIYCNPPDKTKLQGNWKDSLKASENMLKEAWVEINYYEGE